MTDDSFPPVPDYRIREATGMFGRRFGVYLEKNLRTTLRYFERNSDSLFESLSANTAFDWAVTETLSTLLQHDFNRIDTDGLVTTENRGSFSLNHQLWGSLHSNLNLFGTESSRDDGDLTTYGGRLSLAYKKRVAWDSRLLIDLAGGYQVQSNDLTQRFLPVRNELLAVSRFSQLFLQETRILEETIEIALGVDGPLLVEGFDYEVDPIGDRIAINIFPGGLVTIGDVLAVRYDFVVDPSAEIGTTNYRVGVGWNFPWLQIRYEHDRRQDKLL
ncbi:MAG: hypothetical protein JRH01_19920, partial [Deltaproteobacteria bacterium]|nr:hypothetical protein [Deltaproteobacteria bacterium]